MEELDDVVRATLAAANIDQDTLYTLSREEVLDLFPGPENFFRRRRILEVVTRDKRADAPAPVASTSRQSERPSTSRDSVEISSAGSFPKDDISVSTTLTMNTPTYVLYTDSDLERARSAFFEEKRLGTGHSMLSDELFKRLIRNTMTNMISLARVTGRYPKKFEADAMAKRLMEYYPMLGVECSSEKVSKKLMKRLSNVKSPKKAAKRPRRTANAQFQTTGDDGTSDVEEDSSPSMGQEWSPSQEQSLLVEGLSTPVSSANTAMRPSDGYACMQSSVLCLLKQFVNPSISPPPSLPPSLFFLSCQPPAGSGQLQDHSPPTENQLHSPPAENPVGRQLPGKNIQTPVRRYNVIGSGHLQDKNQLRSPPAEKQHRSPSAENPVQGQLTGENIQAPRRRRNDNAPTASCAVEIWSAPASSTPHREHDSANAPVELQLPVAKASTKGWRQARPNPVPDDKDNESSESDFTDSAELQARHHKNLLELYSKVKKPNRDDVSQLLDLEFEARRRFIDADITNPQDRARVVLDAYPCFRELNHTMDELRRIIDPYNLNYLEEVKQRWSSFLENYKFYAIQKKAWIRSQKASKVEQSISLIETLTKLFPSPATPPKRTTSSEALFHVLKPSEDPNAYLQQRPLTTPVVLVNDTNCLLAIHTTPVMTFEREHFEESPIYLMAFYYACHLTYPKCASTVLSVLQTEILQDGLHDGDITQSYKKSMVEWKNYLNQ